MLAARDSSFEEQMLMVVWLSPDMSSNAALRFTFVVFSERLNKYWMTEEVKIPSTTLLFFI